MTETDKISSEKKKELSRRSFLKVAGGIVTLAAMPSFFKAEKRAAAAERQEVVPYDGSHRLKVYDPTKPTVYFTRDLSTEGIQKVYAKINAGITGRVGIKLHTGEPNGPNLLPIEYIKGLQAKVPNSTIVECNVYYGSPRQKTETHREVIKTNGFTFCPVDILDADGDVMLPVSGMDKILENDFHPDTPYAFTPGVHLEEISVGKHLLKYNSLLVYTHFKGHAMGGFGGSLKNIGIGLASGKIGKKQIHGVGWPGGKIFHERMVESGKAIVEHFKNHIAYINVMKNMSVDCDCDPYGVKPTCKDIGVLASTDILAIDQASVDMVYAMPEAERHDLAERIESRVGLRQLEYMKLLGMGSREYNLVEI